MQLKLLEQILDNIDQRPSYVPTPVSTTIDLSLVSLSEQGNDWSDVDCGYYPWPLFEDEQAEGAGIPLNYLSPRAGPLPVPLPETEEDQLPVLSDQDREQLDSLIQSSVEEEPVFGKVQCFLRDGTVTSPYTYERLRRAASEYVLEEVTGYLYRAVLQRPDGTLIRQRVIGRSMRQLAYKLVADLHIKCTHLGAKQLLEKVKEKYHFRNQPKIVRRCLRLCRACLKANAVRRFNSGAGMHHVEDLLPFQVLGVDVYLPYLKDGTKARRPYSGSLVVTCLGSGFQRVSLLTGPITTKSVCSALALLFDNSLWPCILLILLL
ncbi:hypothetical protein FOZ61_007383 [Perkinsus olseni]|uniref:Integrase zinc-binding domain-containing protein n=1 Tax=Perkinsus olseni TaxID=32597 RepID=A0A7J6KXW9_PEROL|nr:hypothetical protein FOL46_000321 [Perkinsus olseni]KAF4655760.1 hypothetical protein FOZ61_007383 [Perkinsus olseni]